MRIWSAGIDQTQLLLLGLFLHDSKSGLVTTGSWKVMR